MSMALWGTVLGSLFGSIPCDRIGRKNTLIWIGILFFVSALGSAIAWDPYSFSFFRFIGGVGVGASTVASPTYISEISNKESGGQVTGDFGLSHGGVSPRESRGGRRRRTWRVDVRIGAEGH